MDLTPLITDDSLDTESYVDGCIARFREEVCDKIRRQIRERE